MNLTTLVLLALKTSIALTVLGFALRTRLAAVTRLFRHPRRLAQALFAMNVIMPLFAVTLALVFDLHPAVKIALVALSVSPIPPLLPRKALKAGGEESYTVSLLAAAGVAAIVLVPVAMELFERIFKVPLAMTPAAIAKVVFSTVLAPLLAGVTIHEFAPRFANRWAKPVSILAGILLIASVLPIIITAWPAIVSLIGNGTIAAMASFIVAGLFFGHAFGGPEDGNRLTLAISTATRHPGVAVAIAQSNFPGEPLAMAAVLLYLIVAAFVSLPYLRWVKRHHPGSTWIDADTPATARIYRFHR
jgi:BASS family bile acid:Na+ symporter